MLIKEYKYRGYNIRWTKDSNGVDIISVSQTTRTCPIRGDIERKKIRWGLQTLTEAENIVDDIYWFKDQAKQLKKTKKRDLAYRQKWQRIYDNDQQDLH
tara:strand:- start:776 stop:1072 length:297 start_codon:yes stop_codon:yes gene_type:complete